MSVVFKSNLKNIASQIERELSEALKETANDIGDLAQQFAPEDTGDLKASKRVKPNGTGWIISFGEGLGYAAFVEYGTSTSPAQPFLTPAAEAIDPIFHAKARIADLIARNRI